MALDEQQFLLLLPALFSEDIAVRSNAERTWDDIATQTRLKLLVSCMRNARVSEKLRETSAYLVRKLICHEFEESYKRLTKDDKAELRSELLIAIQTEKNPTIRRKICAVISALAIRLLESGTTDSWPYLQQAVFEFATTGPPELKESALRIFATVPHVLGDKTSPYFDVIKPMLQQCMTDLCYSVRYQAAKSLCSLIAVYDDATLRKFENLIPYLIQNLYDSIQRQDDRSILRKVINLVELAPRILRNHTRALIQICAQAAANDQLPFSWRHPTLKVITALAKAAPGLVRRSGFVPLIVSTLLKLMTDLEYKSYWDSDGVKIIAAAEERLRVLASGVGGTPFAPHLSSTLPIMLESSDWKYRHAALLAMAAICKGCHRNMEPVLPTITHRVVSLLHDSHPAVREAACKAICRMSHEFEPLFGARYHIEVVPKLLALFDDADLCVQSEAAAALASFGKMCPNFMFAVHFDRVMAKLEKTIAAKLDALAEGSMLNKDSMALEQIVLTIAALAGASEEKTLDYYDRFMLYIKEIVRHCTISSLGMLRGKAVYCASIMGFFVGAENFSQDFKEIMDLLVEQRADGRKANSHLISGWRRMCKIMGAQFCPYLGLVMAQVFRAIRMGVREDSDDDEDNDVNDDEDGNGERGRDLVASCHLLAECARDFKEGFDTYTEVALILLAPLLIDLEDDGVRGAAAKALPYLLDGAKSRGLEFAQDMWVLMLPNLFKAIQEESEKSILARQLTTLAECVESMGFDCLMAEPLKVLQQLLLKLFHGYFERVEERKDIRQEEILDDEDEQDLASEDAKDLNILCSIFRVIRALLAAYQSSSVLCPVLESFMPYVTRLLKNDRSWTEQKLGIRLFNDIVEFTRDGSVKFQELFLKKLYDFLKHESPEVRREAARGWGLLATHGTAIYTIACCQAMPALIELITALDSKATENIRATETAISAVTKVLKFDCSNVLVKQTLPQWLKWFPIFEEKEEAPHVYDYLCDLFEASRSEVTNNATLSRIVHTIAEVLHRRVLAQESKVYRRVVDMMKKITSDNPKCFYECLVRMKPDHQRALQPVLCSNENVPHSC